MLKFGVFISTLVFCGSVQAEDMGPWFGSDVASPEQVSVIVTSKNASDIDRNPNCTIYSCVGPKNIVKPELKSAANP